MNLVQTPNYVTLDIKVLYSESESSLLECAKEIRKCNNVAGVKVCFGSIQLYLEVAFKNKAEVELYDRNIYGIASYEDKEDQSKYTIFVELKINR